MDITFEWSGEKHVLLRDQGKWTLGESRAVERWLERPIELFTMLDQVTASIAVTLRRDALATGNPGFRFSDVDDIESSIVTSILEQVQAAQAAEDSKTPPDGADAETAEASA